MDIRTHIDNNGRLLIPAELRKKLNLKSGSPVVIRVINNEIKIISISEVISEVRDLVRKYIPKGANLSAELRTMRDEEFAKENAETHKPHKMEK